MKNVIITGASQGIGRDLAILFLKKGHKVLVISRNLHKLQALSEECASKHLKIIPFDLTQFNSYETISTEIESFFSFNIDIVINNAGLLIFKPFLELTIEDFQSTYATNVFSVVRLLQVSLPFMKPKSHIVNISSVGGLERSLKFPGLAAYSSSKAALNNITELLAEELKDKKIHINALALGAVQTEMLKKVLPDFKAAVTSKEMANFIYRFATEHGLLINGKIIPISSTTP